MSRSTKADKARQLNAAHKLLERKTELSEAAQSLSREFDLSLRQAYRYLEAAARLDQPVEITEATMPITLKLPPTTARRLRAQARRSGLTIGTIVTRALDAFLSAPKKAWLSGAQRVAHFKFVSTMRLIGCVSPNSRRRTTFWSPDESASSARR